MLAHSHPTVFLHIPQCQTQQGKEALAKPPPALKSLRGVISRPIFIFRTEQLVQIVFKALHLVSTACSGTHQDRAEQTPHSATQISRRKMSSSHSNLPHPLRIPGWAERSAPGSSPSITSIQGQGDSTELLPTSWQQGQCLENVPQQLQG